MAATIKNNEIKERSCNPYKNKVKVGDFYQYKNLCAALGIERKSGGRNIKNQISDLNRYMSIEKDETNGGYIIVDIYDDPLPKIDKRKEKTYATHSIYVKYIELVLLKLLSEEKGYSINRTSKQLYKDLGFANINYFTYENKDKRSELVDIYKNYNIDVLDIDIAYNKCSKKFNKILDDSLKSLENRFIIKRDRVYNIGEKSENGIMVHRTVYSNDTKTINKILVAEQNALERLGLKSEKQLYIFDKYEEFFKYVNQEVKKMYGWEYIYKSHSIVYDKDGVINAISNIELELNKIELNNKIIDSIKKRIETEIENQKKYEVLLNDVIEHLSDDKNDYEDRNDVPNNILPEDTESQIRYRMIQNLLIEELLRL